MTKHSTIRLADEFFMRGCVSLAQKGAGFVSPNPMVGCVIVRGGRLIGRGFHAKFGGPHAEVNAIRSAKGKVRGATLYVNLEPCNFTGKTPPCTDLIIKSGISRVVVGMNDPNPKVSGKGIRQLRRAGIKVETNVLEGDCARLNRAFSKYIKTGMPYVTLKIAQTLDGKIADANGFSKWISNKESRRYSHRLRSEYDAVLVGAGTIRADDPYLTVRHVKGRNPRRVAIIPRLDVSESSHIFSSRSPGSVFVFADSKTTAKQRRRAELFSKRGIEIIFLPRGSDGLLPVKNILKVLGKSNVASVLVEGGAKTFGSFIEKGLADELVIFVAPKILGDGVGSFAFSSPRAMGKEIILRRMTTRTIGNNILIESLP